MSERCTASRRVFEYDRRSRSYLAHIQPLSDPNGVIVGTVGLAIDVTERKRAEEALARREQQLADAQRLAQVGSWEVDLATNRLELVGGGVSHLRPETGARPAVEGDGSGRASTPTTVERSQAVWETTLRTGEPYAWDVRIVRPDGEIRVIHSRGALVRDATGQPERMVGTVPGRHRAATGRRGRPRDETDAGAPAGLLPERRDRGLRHGPPLRHGGRPWPRGGRPDAGAHARQVARRAVPTGDGGGDGGAAPPRPRGRDASRSRCRSPTASTP